MGADATTGPPAPKGSRVAVIVVPGVGDDARGATVETVSAHLQTRGYRHGERHELLTAQHEKVDEAYSSVWVRLTRGDVPNGDGTAAALSTVDIYEMRWSDLSRFPNRAAAFLLGAWGLVLQIPTLALEALRNLRDDKDNPFRPQDFEKTKRKADTLRRRFELLSWWLAVPLLLVPASLIGLVAAVWLSFNAYSSLLAMLGLAAILGVFLAAAVVGGRKLRAGGWGEPAFKSLGEARRAGRAVRYASSHPVYWAVAIVLGVAATFITVLCSTHSGEDEPTLAVVAANTTVLVSSYAVRVVWLLASVLVAVLLVRTVLVGRTAAREGQQLGARARRTAVAAIAIAPLGLAVVNSIALGVVSAGLLRLSRSDDWSANEEQDLRCLTSSDDWRPGDCREGALTGMENWGRELFGQLLAPAVIVAGLLLLLVVLPIVGCFWGYIWLAVRSVVRRPPAGERGEVVRTTVAQEQGTAFRAGLRRIGRAGPALIGAATFLSIAGVAVAWLPLWSLESWLWIDHLTGVGAAYAITAILAAGIALGTGLLPNGGPLRVVWTVMDVVYDIAAYRRITYVKPETPPEQGEGSPEGAGILEAEGAPGEQPRSNEEVRLLAPREKMFARYTELIRYISEGREGLKYERIVILAHSQGCVVTVGALFGEPAWEESALERQITKDARDRTPWTPPPIFLLTCGNPISQLYRAMLPGSYDWVADPSAPGPGPNSPVKEWVNLYRAGDYVGRSLWSLDQLAEAAFWSGGSHPRIMRPEIGWQGGTTATGTRDPVATERCIGPGGHTGYWSKAEILDELRLMIEGRPAGPASNPGGTT